MGLLFGVRGTLIQSHEISIWLRYSPTTNSIRGYSKTCIVPGRMCLRKTRNVGSESYSGRNCLTPGKLGDVVISEIKDTYDGVAVGSDLDEEILVNILEAVFAKKYFSLLSQANNTKLTSTSQITKTYRDFEKLVENAADEVFNPNSVLLPMTIMDIPIGEILTTLMTNLVTVETNDILKTYIPLNQQLARFKRMLVKNDEDGNQDNYLSIGGNC